jgi:hypothetical protein
MRSDSGAKAQRRRALIEVCEVNLDDDELDIRLRVAGSMTHGLVRQPGFDVAGKRAAEEL